ncbi:LAME_0F15390g1_1 [Lachancea meyersii CBS 8951]|uniref:LAME_0F15390g1_1 n=1 Tax=Lachancea meyersii CBS 8951 TaxID=1266667 RepID=A0A1G4JYG7_9SACH|nr:LAME_0F15390g1_1 [Lachancea meyersii CBS 8951]
MLRATSLRASVRAMTPASARFPLLKMTTLAVFTRPFSVSRFQHNEAPKGPPVASKTAAIKTDKPAMMIAFTCKKCNTRSSHTMSKQAYTKGTVLIQCPGCKSRHLIADHLKIFSDSSITVQDILGAKGESVALTTDDLAFEDIPEKLRDTIGHHAKDAPKKTQQKHNADAHTAHALPANNNHQH